MLADTSMPSRLALLAAALCLAPAAAASFARGPYLVDASSVSARICWRDAAGRDGCGDWEDLDPGATFAYTLPGSTGPWTARTLPAPGHRLRFAVLGDSGEGSASQARVAAMMDRWDPDLVLLAGDVVYPGGRDKNYDARFFAPYAALLPRCPFFPAVGNHDYGERPRLGGAREAFRAGYSRVFRRPAYYSFDAGDAHVAVIDANREGFGIAEAPSLAAGSPQRDWLARDLGASRARWKFVLMHEPLYSSGAHGGSKALRDSLEPLFEERGVDAVFQGHYHGYERTQALGGVTYFVVGTGGGRLDPRREAASWSAKELAVHGFLGVTLDGEAAIFEFYDDTGALLDSWRMVKRR